MSFGYFFLVKSVWIEHIWIRIKPFVSLNGICRYIDFHSFGDYYIVSRDFVVLESSPFKNRDRWIQSKCFWKNNLLVIPYTK